MSGRVRFARWLGAEGLGAGLHEGTTIRDGLLVIGEPTGTREYDDPYREGPPAGYQAAVWTSPEVLPGFPFSELVASWNARTPEGTWLEIGLRTNGPAGWSPWYVMGRWAETDRDIAPTSVPGQSDAHAEVDVDRLSLRDSAPGSTYQLRVSLLRRPGSGATPAVSLLGCVASDSSPTEPPATLMRHQAAEKVLDVPAYSQRLHLGEYPQWAGGGESWCSPTATSMVLAHWGMGPMPQDYAWVDEGLADRFVPYAARHTFDHAYGGPGNWSFNVAYAARFGTEAFVTRLRSLTQAELFVAAGIPLVVAVAFTRAELAGAHYDTEGHLTVIVGFDAHGDVVCNDPASRGIPSNDAVRASFDREQFERAWMRSSGGVTYVIHPPGVSLPEAPPEPNW